MQDVVAHMFVYEHINYYTCIYTCIKRGSECSNSHQFGKKKEIIVHMQCIYTLYIVALL